MLLSRCSNFSFVVALHFLLADPSVGGTSEQDDPIGNPPEERLDFAVPVGSQHGLGASFGRAGYIVR